MEIMSCGEKRRKGLFFELFCTISDGKYASLLYSLFGKDRVEAELKEYLTLDFFPRFGAGIGITRLEQACIKAGIFEQPIFSTSRVIAQKTV